MAGRRAPLHLCLPKELGLPSTTVGKRVRCCYGTRDAECKWETVDTDCLTQMAFLQGRASPCWLYHPAWDVHVVVHGNDVAVLGAGWSLRTYENDLPKCNDMKCQTPTGKGTPGHELC